MLKLKLLATEMARLLIGKKSPTCNIPGKGFRQVDSAAGSNTTNNKQY